MEMDTAMAIAQGGDEEKVEGGPGATPVASSPR